jgi:hypothetical protein
MNIPYSIIQPFEPLGFPLISRNIDAHLIEMFDYINYQAKEAFPTETEEDLKYLVERLKEYALYLGAEDASVSYTTAWDQANRKIGEIFYITYYMPDGSKHMNYGLIDKCKYHKR